MPPVAHLRKGEYAPGIPEKGKIVPLPLVAGRPREFEFVIQGHQAERAGPHLDLRVGDTETGVAHSWALKKLPGPGQSTYAIRQSEHTIPYMDFTGDIESGYGAGSVRQVRREKAEVLKSDPREMRFNLYGRRIPEQFVLRDVGGPLNRKWVLHNATPARTTGKWSKLVPESKPPMKEVPIPSLDIHAKDQVLQPKIDGAHALMVLEGGRPVRLFSYRRAKNETGLIEHTFRFPDFHRQVAPEGLRPTVVRGEVYALKGEKPIPAHEVGALLNASVPRSREMQSERETPLRFMGYELVRHEGKAVDGKLPYDQQLKILNRLAREVPALDVMPTARTPAQKEKLRREIQAGEHGLTREGLIARSKATGEALKAKIISDHDVYVREIYPGEREGEAGGFRFSWEPEGPIAGNVGTGYSHALRKEMLGSSSKFVGRVAKVKTQEVYPSGAMRVPVFRAWHETKGLQPHHELPVER